MERVSILIPTYKRPDIIVEAVKSCIDQTLKPFEIIIGDDSPDDLTKVKIEELKAITEVSIRYIHNNPPLRQAKNVRMLFDSAEGDKLMLLHDDDMLVPQSLELLISCFRKDPTISVAYGKQYIMTNDGSVSIPRSESFNKAFYRTKEYEGSVLTSLEAGMVQQFPNNAYLVDSTLAKEINYADVGDVCDFDFGFRTGQTGKKFYFINEYTAKYRVSDNCVSTNALYDSGLNSYLMVKNAVVPEQSLELKNKWLKSRVAVAVGQAIANKKISLALKIFFNKDHFPMIFTPGGVRRFLNILTFGRYSI